MRRVLTFMMGVAVAVSLARAEGSGRGSDAPGSAPGRHWAFEAVKKVEPLGGASGWASHPIDLFITAKQREAGVTPVARASKRTLIRRAYFDLIGLPPTPEEVERFLNDDSPAAFEKVIDALLARPEYGERWGRHWLDVARYADTAGDNSDYPVPQMWRYRNWVIAAFNSDKPYGRFLTEQLAGDLLPYATHEQRNDQLIATGYVALSRRFSSRVDPYPMWLTIDDTIDNVGKAMLGMTLACARCHDHKYDPVSMADYYGLYGIFKNTTYPFPGVELLRVQGDLPLLIPEGELNEAQRKHYEHGRALMAKLVAAQAAMMAGDARMSELRELIDAEEDDQERQKLRDEMAEVKEQRTEARKSIEPTAQELQEHEREGPRLDLAYAIGDAPGPAGGAIGDARIHVKGEPTVLGESVPRGFIEVLGGQKLSLGETGSGRLALAGWITDPANPLTARVMVNRIWLHHFGKGLVSTPTDFGLRGAMPTHPELLDYLAARFIESGWSVKAMHKLIMTSATWQLGGGGDVADVRGQADPVNALYWRYEPQRLDAETIRDAMLAVAGTLDRRPMDDPHPFPPLTEWNFSQHRPFKGDPAEFDHRKRSVYLMTQRIAKHPFLALFDGPDTNVAMADRATSTTPLQSLYFMNDPFVHEQSGALGARLLASGGTADERIAAAYELALSRAATVDELEKGRRFVATVADAHRAAGNDAAEAERLAWESFARVVFRLNEFVYVE